MTFSKIKKKKKHPERKQGTRQLGSLPETWMEKKEILPQRFVIMGLKLTPNLKTCIKIGPELVAPLGF